MDIFKKEKIRKVPTKNYIYLFIIIIASIALMLYILEWYKTYNESKLNTGILNNYLQVINYNELDDYIVENKNAVIYVTILGNEEIRKFENNFKNTIMDNNLRDKMLNNLPYLVIYTNGKITDTYSIAEKKYNTKKIIKYLNRIGATEID